VILRNTSPPQHLDPAAGSLPCNHPSWHIDFERSPIFQTNSFPNRKMAFQRQLINLKYISLRWYAIAPSSSSPGRNTIARTCSPDDASPSLLSLRLTQRLLDRQSYWGRELTKINFLQYRRCTIPGFTSWCLPLETRLIASLN